MSEPLRICLVASELAPFAKTGGLGDVTAALARYLHQAGHDVRPILPYYSSLAPGGQRLVPVDFLTDRELKLGRRTLGYTVYTTALPVRSPSGAPLTPYFVRCPPLFDRPGIYTGTADEPLRFAFLSQVAIECCQRMGWAPHVFHCNDWHTALVPLYLRSRYSWDRLFADSRTMLTIHNIGYQGVFDAAVLAEINLAGDASHLYQEDLRFGRVNFLKTGLLYAGVITTVSRTHAREIQSERYGMGLEGMLRARADHLVGIVNGIDDDVWNPATDPHLPHNYSADEPAAKAANKRHLLDGMGLSGEEDVPLAGIVSRFTAQKGCDLYADVLPAVLEHRDLRLAVLGSGEPRYEELFNRLARAYRGRVAFHRGFNEPLAHLIEAASDLFLMPSLYEPCGLNQMYSQRYGTVPVVRRTGGLADTVEPYDPVSGEGTGFVFDHPTPEGLAWALNLALDTYGDRPAWERLRDNGMRRDFSWQRQIDKYVGLYRALAEGRL